MTGWQSSNRQAEERTELEIIFHWRWSNWLALTVHVSKSE
ncbi:hypothetical protein BH10PLA2_BH10PLA2_28860 [soil metagenome]